MNVDRSSGYGVKIDITILSSPANSTTDVEDLFRIITRSIEESIAIKDNNGIRRTSSHQY
jgi:hypothetical protein